LQHHQISPPSFRTSSYQSISDDLRLSIVRDLRCVNEPFTNIIMPSRKLMFFTGSVARHGIFSDLVPSFAMSANSHLLYICFFSLYLSRGNRTQHRIA
jgi:hypothetical protein